ncbi:hypothetical protein NQ318_011722 [Aromia moschata]|uniref:Uncharacterized protein n=1 Tax=Aromia moschata TaxID=1265417 RepID=A0AAV8XQU5_9CUCU|nr:hypothetical protein NQ318_011722 [Aromia moschata]
MSLAAVEHALINVYRLKICLDQESTLKDALKVYFVKMSYSAIFDVVEFSFWKGLIAEFISLQMAFIWNYSDIFIMLIGSALKFKLEQITKRITSLCKIKVNDKRVWHSVRVDYLQLSNLCESSNKRLSYLIIVSYCADLYLILIQLFSCLRPGESLEKVYLFISFVLLLIRLTCVCIFGSKLNDEWQNICFALQSAQSSAYNSEKLDEKFQ